MRPRDSDERPIVLGLVNNMPDAALRTTERQFRELLSAVSQDVPVCLRLYSLPEVPRSDGARSYIDQHYEDISELWASHVDGLIVTGTEPRAPDLTNEPYWLALTKLVDWAEDHTISAVWSCLAAHAAVLHIDGIVRIPFGEKLFGLFECVKTTDHAIVLDAPPGWRVPHSRYNGLPEESLVERGYRILSWSAEAGADMFIAKKRSLFLFLQGHLEYDSGSLFREYRRDVSRFLGGERKNYPEIPRDYFDEESAAAFASFRREALRNRDINLLSTFPSVAERKLQHVWRGPARRVYANWLAYLVKHRARSRDLVSSGALHEDILEV